MNTLRELLAADEPTDLYGAARWLWLQATAARWQDAMHRCAAAWTELVKDIPEDEIDDVEVPPPPEEAEVDALWQQLDDVIQKDLWPKELYFGGI
ncbi:MAG: hypothetical protein V4502_08835 [Pseudomonadota bacterium]